VKDLITSPVFVQKDFSEGRTR